MALAAQRPDQVEIFNDSVDQPNKAPVIENDLTPIGKSQSPNLIFKPATKYEQEQNLAALQKLESIRDLQGGTNQWAEIAVILKEVLAMDASREIKRDAVAMALLELAGTAERDGNLHQAQQFLAEFIERYPKDTIVPEILLRQSYLFRKMGAFDRAVDTLYRVFRAALSLQTQSLGYYQRVVLTAKTEMADLNFEQGKYDPEYYKTAAEQYALLLKQPDEQLNVPIIHAKMIRCLDKIGDRTELIRQSSDFLRRYSNNEQTAEVRYLLAMTYKKQGRKADCLRELLLLLESMEVDQRFAAKWNDWRMLAGNEIGNQLYLEGDFLNAIQVYQGLLKLDDKPNWTFPLYYQLGLCFEKLNDPMQASKNYQQIVNLFQKVEIGLDPHLQMVVEMARFRVELLSVSHAAAGLNVN